MNGVEREAGIGKFGDLSLSEARSVAGDMRWLKALGKDPLEERRRLQAMTFRACSAAYIKSQRSGWRNAKTAVRWTSSLRDYADPVFGELSVAAVDTPLVLRAIEPIWLATPETGRRLRLQIERILDWATAHKYRTGDNPASMKLLTNLLPGQTGIVRHHPALPAGESANFMRDLRRQEGMAAMALEFTILTAARTGETIGATWSEVDLKEKVWTVPAIRMKSPRDHRVPLSDSAIVVLSRVKTPHMNDHAFVFPGGKVGMPLSNMAMLAVLKRMGRSELTTRGFRSTFRDWAAELGFPREVAEAALAHAVGDRVEAAYLRTTLFDRRRKMMDAWAEACSQH